MTSLNSMFSSYLFTIVNNDKNETIREEIFHFALDTPIDQIHRNLFYWILYQGLLKDNDGFNIENITCVAKNIIMIPNIILKSEYNIGNQDLQWEFKYIDHGYIAPHCKDNGLHKWEEYIDGNINNIDIDTYKIYKCPICNLYREEYTYEFIDSGLNYHTFAII